jgi:hypothetical protein
VILDFLRHADEHCSSSLNGGGKIARLGWNDFPKKRLEQRSIEMSFEKVI